MVTQLQLPVRTAMPDDRQALANLIHFEVFVHRHLDWRHPLDWLGYQPYLLVEQNGQAVSTLACPPDPPHVAWIRLFAVGSGMLVDNAWNSLWSTAHDLLAGEANLTWAAAIPLQSWFERLLKESGFVSTHQIVILTWERGRLPLEDLKNGIKIRPMIFDDLPAVHAVDTASFDSLWQNSLPTLELAFRQSAVATVAEDNGQLVGYQISTATVLGGHLARLAVIPERQGRGIGYELVRDSLSQFERRGARGVTVNTQQNNLASLTLYQKAGFHRTGEEYPVYQYRIRERTG
jgi:ribosomal protein S18 acetylase RimI-like enzyme